MEPYKLFEAEMKFLELVWELEPINSTELSRVVTERLGWKKPTTFNMIRKLSERGALQNEGATVSSLVRRKQVLRYESHSLIDRLFDGSLAAFLTAYLDKAELSEKEAKKLTKIIKKTVK